MHMNTAPVPSAKIRYRTVILDFDGTLADTSAGILATVRETLSTLSLGKQDPHFVKSLIGLPLVKMFEEMFPGGDSALWDECCRTYRRLFPSIAFGNVPLFPEVSETLHALHDEGVLLAIASSRSHSSLDRFLSDFGLCGIVGPVLGDGDVQGKKPAPDMVLSVLSTTGTAPSEALTVGDTIFDIRMGKGAFTPTCAVSFGNQDRELLESESPTYIIDRFGALLDIVLCR